MTAGTTTTADPGSEAGSARPSEKSSYLPTLDGWRCIAISMVLLSHGTPFVVSNGLLRTILQMGEKGVSLFFGISGFLICSRLLKEESKYGRISLAGFYIRRAFRILPPAFTYLICISLLGVLGWIAVSPLEVTASALFFRNYMVSLLWPSPNGWYTGHYWSLSVEEHFYLAWPTLLLLLGRKRCVWFAVAASLLSAGLRFAHLGFLRYHFATQYRLDAILCGCLAALLLEHKWFRSWVVRARAPVWWGCGLFYVAVLCFTRQPLLPEAAVVPLILAGTVLHPASFVSRCLEWAPIRWVGRLSYSLYLWQQLFLTHTNATLPVVQTWPFNVFAAFVFAAASYYLVEQPMIRVGHRIAGAIREKRKQAAVAAAATA